MGTVRKVSASKSLTKAVAKKEAKTTYHGAVTGRQDPSPKHVHDGIPVPHSPLLPAAAALASAVSVSPATLADMAGAVQVEVAALTSDLETAGKQAVAGQIVDAVSPGDGSDLPVLTQDVLRRFYILLLLDSKLGKAMEYLKKTVIAYKKAGGRFELGALATKFDSSDKRSPKWKEEAIKLARAAAVARGDASFDGEAWAKQIADSYPPTTSHSFEIIESG
jgi:hypothetical protein